MSSANDYWEEEYKGLNPETYDYSQSKPSFSLLDFCNACLQSAAVILDLGCGEGRNAHYLAQQGYKVYGVDIAMGAVKFCEGRFALHRLSGTFKQGTLDHIPFPDNYFDCVICIAAMDHATLETAQHAMSEIRRTLVPRGIVLLTFDPQDTDDDLVGDAEILADGTLKFFRGIQTGMLFRRYADQEIKSLVGEEHIVSFSRMEHGSRIVVCRFDK